MKVNHKIFKGCFKYPATFFTLSTMYQWFVNRDIRWTDNIAISIMMIFGYMFVNWTDIPYKWKKSTDNKSNT